MTRRDYVMLSSALDKARTRAIGQTQTRGVEYAAQEIGRAIALQNRAFDYPRFLQASGVQTRESEPSSNKDDALPYG